MVEVEQGMVEGKTVPFQNDFIGIDENIDVFLGIPFAEPPLGECRFTAPIPKAPWAEGEVYDATYFRDICVQANLETIFFTTSEDCLHLNVYAPNPKVRLTLKTCFTYIMNAEIIASFHVSALISSRRGGSYKLPPKCFPQRGSYNYMVLFGVNV